jgi:hypothetical protein
MNAPIKTTAWRQVTEWTLHSQFPYPNPFTDVRIDAQFNGPSSQSFTVPAFYDGRNIWCVRFGANETGNWTYQFSSWPENPDFDRQGNFQVDPSLGQGYLKATPGKAWGFQYESGEPAFLLGDTTYNLFGMAHCAGDVASFLERRARQGFNLLRVRVPVSPFHPPEGYSHWQTRRTWPWGGSEQAPCFDRFDLEYFATVDQVVRQAEELGLGLEMIMEAWGFEFPFNSRQIFVPEWEELWLRYLIARYDAFNCVYFWTLMNEYEYYPDGKWHHNPVADRWAMRVGRWVKGVAQHGHIVAVHNGPHHPPFAQRFAADPQAIDAIMFQEWGTRDAKRGWLAAGIEITIRDSLDSWPGVAVFAEYGYERNPDLPLLISSHAYCDSEHTRRGAWRGAFCGLGVIHGFETSWGPFMLLEKDQPGLVYLGHLRHFLTEIVPFQDLVPAQEILLSTDYTDGHQPLVLATDQREFITVYLPIGGNATLAIPAYQTYDVCWYDPRTGELRQDHTTSPGEAEFTSPAGQDQNGHPWDWVLLLSSNKLNRS